MMKFKAIAVATACMTVLSLASAQAATHKRHTMRVAHHHSVRGPVAAGANVAAGAVNTAGAVAAGAVGTGLAIASAPFGGPYASVQGGYYSPSTWGDYECSPHVAGCRPYAAKEWYRR